MITEANRDNLYRITSNLSYKDYKQGRTDGRGFHKRISYSLSGETLEALLHYETACRENITKEQEEEVKAYLLKIRLAYPDLWEQTNPNYEQWKRVRGISND